MTVLALALVWQRTDGTGCEFAVFDDCAGPRGAGYSVYQVA
jgi:hypothetical protein